MVEVYGGESFELKKVFLKKGMKRVKLVIRSNER